MSTDQGTEKRQRQKEVLTTSRPFNREKFLLFMLAGIFIWQAAIFTGGVIGCFRAGAKGACPDLGDRYENTVGIMVATTLALLGASAVSSVTQQSSSGDRVSSVQEKQGVRQPYPPQPKE